MEDGAKRKRTSGGKGPAPTAKRPARPLGTSPPDPVDAARQEIQANYAAYNALLVLASFAA